jgi:hypothetical protein
MLSAQNFCPILPKFGFSRRTFMEVSSTKFNENPSNRSRADTDGRTDKHDKTTGALHEYTNAPKNAVDPIFDMKVYACV